MKLSESQLRKIIKEAIGEFDMGYMPGLIAETFAEALVKDMKKSLIDGGFGKGFVAQNVVVTGEKVTVDIVDPAGKTFSYEAIVRRRRNR